MMKTESRSLGHRYKKLGKINVYTGSYFCLVVNISFSARVLEKFPSK